MIFFGVIGIFLLFHKRVTIARERFSDYFSDCDVHTVNWVVDPFKCEIANIPEEPPGLPEAIELRPNTKARIQIETKANLSSFWLSKAAKAFKIAQFFSEWGNINLRKNILG